VQALLERLTTLSPVEGQEDDELTCNELRKILRSSDVDVRRLAREIEAQINPGWLRRNLGGLFGYFDRKADKAVEAAASTATKQLLSGGL
jgi:hypothetical protein